MGHGKRIDDEVEAAETLSKLVASTNNGVFLAVQAYLLRAEFPTSEVLTAYITNILPILPKRC